MAREIRGVRGVAISSRERRRGGCEVRVGRWVPCDIDRVGRMVGE